MTVRMKVALMSGASLCHPLVSVGITAHEIGHGITESRSGQRYDRFARDWSNITSGKCIQSLEFGVEHHDVKGFFALSALSSPEK